MIKFLKFDANGKLISSSVADTYNEIMPESEREGFIAVPPNIDSKDIPYCKKINGQVVVDTVLKNIGQTKRKNELEIEAIEIWFQAYDKKVVEHGRCVRLGIPCHHDIISLDTEARQKQERLKSLRLNV